jgi:hypothetical protein
VQTLECWKGMKVLTLRKGALSHGEYVQANSYGTVLNMSADVITVQIEVTPEGPVHDCVVAFRREVFYPFSDEDSPGLVHSRRVQFPIKQGHSVTIHRYLRSC